MTSTASTTYVYDGDGNRVEKLGGKIYWYAGGEVLDETDATGSTTNNNFNEYFYFGGSRIARRGSSDNVLYYLADQLGSARVIAKVLAGQNTATMCYDADFEPYGGEHAYTNTCVQNYKFTGKERDTESGLDNFGARYYASTTGRFMSPDWALRPIAVPYATFGDPQTLNLYTYVENSPLNRIDADGHAGTQGGIGAQSGDACSGVGLVCDRDAGGGHLVDYVLGAMSAGEARTVDGNPAQFDVAQNTTQTETQTQTQPKQLSADDVSKGIQSAKEDTGSNAKKSVDFLNSFGTNWKLSGDALRQGLKDSKVDAHGVDKKVDSVSRTGDQVTVQLNKGINLLIYKTKTTITFDVGNKGGRPALVNIQGVEVFHGYHYVPKTDYGPD